MQCKVTHHICYGFWFSPKNSRKLIQKSDFVAHFQRIFVYVLLRPAIYVPIFCQMKGLLKIHNLGKFHYYSYCGCEVINFQNFSYWFSIHEMALFGFFWALIPPNCQILLNFLPEVVFLETKTVFEEYLKNSKFYGNGMCQTLLFFGVFVQFWLPEGGRNRNN